MSIQQLNNLNLKAGLEANGDVGSAGQVLSSTGPNGVEWINQSAITASSDFIYYEVKNETGSTILKGKGVMAVGTDGNSGHILVDEMVADGTITPRYFLGVLETSVDNGGFARVIAFGELDQFNTNGQNGETWSNGQVLWCDPDSPGDFTITEPDGPNVKIPAAFILKASTNGKIQVRVQANEGVKDLYDTKIDSQVDGDVLVWDNTTGVWFNNDTLSVKYSERAVAIGDFTPPISGKLQISNEATDVWSTLIQLNSTGTQSRMSINNNGTGDSQINFQLLGSSKFTLGVDNSDSDKFKISGSSVLGSNDRLVIDSSGNVGIGTTSPDSKLQISGSGTQRLRITSTDGANADLSCDGVSSMTLGSPNGIPLRFATSNAERMRIQSSGSVGIGTTSPSTKLHVFGTTSSIPALGAAPSAAHFGASAYGTLFSTLPTGRGVIQQGRVDGTATSYDLLLQPSGGNVAIGLTSATQKLHVDGNARVTGAYYDSSNVPGTSGQILSSTATGTNWISGDERYFRRFYGTATGVSNAGFTTAFTVNGSNLASSIRMSVQGTTTGIVVSNLVDILVNHYQDIMIKSLSGVFTKLTLKVVSNNNENFAVELKTNSGTAVNLSIEVLCYGAETVTFTNSHSYTGATLEKELPYGEYISGTGGNNGDSIVDGDVGIGTTSPAYKLDVNGTIASSVSSGVPELRLSDAVSDFVISTNTGGEGIIKTVADKNIRFFRNDSTETMRIAAVTGNVGIGTTSPGKLLELSGTENVAAIRLRDTTSNVWDIQNSSLGKLDFIRGGTNTYMRIDQFGNVGIGTTSPGQKLSVEPGADVSAEIGKAHIGNVGYNGYAGFSHVDKNSAGNYALLHEASGQTYLNASAAQNIRFRINNTDKMILTSGGNFGVGTTSPTQKLAVSVTDTTQGFSVGAFRFDAVSNYGSSKNILFHRQDANQIVVNEDGADLDFRVEGSSDANLFKVDSGLNSVGIGTASPSDRLEVAAANSQLRLTDTDDSKFTQFSYSSGKLVVRNNSTTTTTNQFTLDAAGQMGIGTTSPTQKLHVAGSVLANGAVYVGSTANSVVSFYGSTDIQTSSGGSVLVRNGFTYKPIQASAFTVSSDYRLKSNITPLENAIDRLNQLNVHRFNWNDRLDEPKVDGFIAHEVSSIIPEAVLGEKDEVYEDGTPKHQGIDQAKIVPLLTAALQEAILKIEQLETRIQTLENN